MISFYPGPSRVHDKVPKYVKDAHRKGILSMNHRSEEFVAMSKRTVELLKQKLNIPNHYSIYFTSSATECWEIIAQSLIKKESIHIFNGAFGEKWFDYTKRLSPLAQPLLFKHEDQLVAGELIFKSGDLICITQNETSNGTQISDEIIGQIKKQNPDHLIAVDVTSSLAGIALNFKTADVWFASVQKCFGLPAGLGIMICSPKAIERMKLVNDKKHYNSLSFMHEMMDKWQTTYTPNVLGIYLLMRTLKKRDAIDRIDKKIKKRHHEWLKVIEACKSLKLFVKNEVVQSYTVLTVAGTNEMIEKTKSVAKKNGFLLGEGYGPYKQNTFRIANFPALKKKEIRSLMTFLLSH
jgi:phosphoserine aminotransferase